MKLWYRKIVDLTKIKINGRFLLLFGAVDQFTEVFINKNKVVMMEDKHLFILI
jgi:hypothetical protein